MNWNTIDLRIHSIGYLRASDECYYARERLIHGKWDACDGNQDITNFQIPLDQHHRMVHKKRAIMKFVEELSCILNEPAAIMPMPSSKKEESEKHDPRLYAVCKQYINVHSPHTKLVRGIKLLQDIESAKTGGPRDPDVLKAYYEVQELPNSLRELFIIDDCITSGSHFRAVKDLLISSYPLLKIVGIFWTRNVNTLTKKNTSVDDFI